MNATATTADTRTDNGASTETGNAAQDSRGTAPEFHSDTAPVRTVAQTDDVQQPAPPQYGAPQPAAPAQAQAQAQAQPQPLDQRNANAFSIASFVLGLVSIVAGWSFFAPVTGLVLGIIALRRGTGERTFALWGVWLNGVLLALTVLVGLVLFGIFGIGILAAAI